MRVGRWVRTPKGLVLLILAGLAVLAAIGTGAARVAPILAGAIIPPALIDLYALRVRRRRWVFPDGALITGLIVAMILAPEEPWYVAAVTATVAVASKYVLRSRKANIFNPAALALVATFYVFDPAQDWWGALADLPAIAIVALLATGIFISLRVNKLPAVLAFLGGYYLLVSGFAFLGDPAGVAELYRTPDLNAALYFAFFMVSDPPTSPPAPRDQLVFGALVAVASVAAFELVGAAYFLLVGLLVANVHEAWRRRGGKWVVSPSFGANSQ
jgi:Na+-translocating ferredoxin:NAD+ oxidoreductase RnfD subunit